MSDISYSSSGVAYDIEWWILCRLFQVSPTSLNRVLSAEAYLLFYTKSNKPPTSLANATIVRPIQTPKVTTLVPPKCLVLVLLHSKFDLVYGCMIQNGRVKIGLFQYTLTNISEAILDSYDFEIVKKLQLLE